MNQQEIHMEAQATEPTRGSSSTLRVGLGFAAWAVVPGQIVADAGLRAIAAGWRSPVLVPVRRPLGAVMQAAEQRGARAEVSLVPRAQQTIVGILENALTSSWSRSVVRRALASPLAETAAEAALRGPIVDAVLRWVVAEQVPERLAKQLLEARTVERLIALAGEEHAGARTADALLADDETARLVTHLVEHPALSELFTRTLASDTFERRMVAVLNEPALERLLACALASTCAQSATDQLLASDELRRVISHIASSEDARAALRSQSAGLATDVADEVRERATTVDDGLDSAVRRVFRRRAPAAPVTELDRELAP